MKMDRNFFKDARIKKLRRIAGGDTFTIIYLELLLLSLEKNGLLIYEGIENSFEEEMASKIGFIPSKQEGRFSSSFFIIIPIVRSIKSPRRFRFPHYYSIMQ